MLDMRGTLEDWEEVQAINESLHACIRGGHGDEQILELAFEFLRCVRLVQYMRRRYANGTEGSGMPWGWLFRLLVRGHRVTD